MVYGFGLFLFQAVLHLLVMWAILIFLKKDFIETMRTFVANAIKNKELAKIPVEVFWSVAYAPLYQLVKYHMDGASLPGLGPFVLTDKIMNQALALVVKGLSP